MRASQSSRSSASCLGEEKGTVISLSWTADELPLQQLFSIVKFSSKRLDDQKLKEKYSGIFFFFSFDKKI
jgi:hypothetical protein